MARCAWLAASFVLLVSGCFDPTAVDGSVADAGTNDAGADPELYDSAAENPDFIIEVTSLELIDHPTAYEKVGFRGGVTVWRRGTLVANATVKANGVVLPLMPVQTAVFTVNGVSVPGVGPGNLITFTATDGLDEARLVLKCPTEVQITQPLEGSVVKRGPLTVSWTGRIRYGDEWDDSPSVSVRPFDADANQFRDEWGGGTAGTFAYPSASDTSVELLAPTTASGYAVELRVQGPTPRRSMTVQASETRCKLVRRVHLRSE